MSRKRKTSPCRVCKQTILPLGRAAFTDTCITCGAHEAKGVKHTIVPGHKSNYMLVTNRADLIGMNNKGGQNRT